jgi:hypothetical protein
MHLIDSGSSQILRDIITVSLSQFDTEYTHTVHSRYHDIGEKTELIPDEVRFLQVEAV